jgi:hypothetical protein
MSNDDSSVPAELAHLSRTTEQWIGIINTILEKKPHLISVESTDHEFRTDDRNIIAFYGTKCHVPIDSLAHNIAKDHKLLTKLLEVYEAIQKKNVFY